MPIFFNYSGWRSSRRKFRWICDQSLLATFLLQYLKYLKILQLSPFPASLRAPSASCDVLTVNPYAASSVALVRGTACQCTEAPRLTRHLMLDAAASGASGVAIASHVAWHFCCWWPQHQLIQRSLVVIVLLPLVAWLRGKSSSSSRNRSRKRIARARW